MPSRRTVRWIGRWIAAVGLLHLLGGFFIYADAWALIAGDGVIASVGDFDSTATAFWFAAAGPLMIIVGGLVDELEKGGGQLPAWLSWAMAALVAALILPMPATGAWLLLPPTVALLVRTRRHRGAVPK